MKIRIAIATLFVSALAPLCAFADATTTPDTTAPTITAPIDQTFATTTIPAFPSLTPATATDETDPSPVITYSPLSFPLGTTTVLWTATDSSGNLATTTSQVGIYTPIVADTATIALRTDSTLVGPFTVTLPASGSPATDVTATGSSTPHSVPARSVLALLVALDAAQTEFEITDLQYSYDFGSFYVACISIPSASASPECYNWQYAVDGVFPPSGMDTYSLANGNAANLFFGNSWNVSADKSTATTEESFTATATKYDPVLGSFVAAQGVMLGVVSIPDAGTPWIYNEIATSTADANGQATFSIATAGSYSIGISESGYYPLAAITITEPAAPSNTGGGGGGIAHYQLNVSSALAYLASQQHADGSFGSSLYSDWAALAFAAQDTGTARAQLREHLLTSAPSLSSAADYERHAMALMALDINPYSGGPADYISPILNKFDGTQIGDASFENDDIFALFPLTHAGYGANDDVIQKAVAFIISRQLPSGAWTGGVDMTAAAVQALAPLSSLPNVPAALTKAESYLRTQQQTNGGFGNSFGTSWTLQAIAALGQSNSGWTAGGLMPSDYLASLQQPDGGIEPIATDTNTRVWATAYAIPASLGKTWNSLLSSYPRPVSTISSGAATTVTATSTATSTLALVATSTPPVATTTPAVIATSTPLVADTGITNIVATTTAPKPQPKAKLPTPKKVVPVAAASTSSPATTTAQAQIAAAGSVNTSGGFLSGLWRSIVSFFGSIF